MWLSTNWAQLRQWSQMKGHSVKVNVLFPWMAKMADRSMEKEMVQRIQGNIWLLNVMMYNTMSKQVGKATIENSGLPTKTTKGRKYQSFRCKRGWLHTSDTVSIFLFLLKFMSTEQRSYLDPLGTLGWNILISPCCIPQKPLAWISALADHPCN